MERTIQRFDCPREADRADREYYASLTGEERLDIALELAKRYREGLGEAAQRFERVYRVAQLSES
jgi:hypothetical protein